MSIKVDKFLEFFKNSSINKINLKSALKISVAYTYNEKTDSIELRSKPSFTIVKISIKDNNNNNTFIENKEKVKNNLEKFNKNISEIKFDEEFITISTDKEESANKILNFLKENNINSVFLKTEDIKNKLINEKKRFFSNPSDFNPRKISESINEKVNNLGSHNHENLNINNTNRYLGKKSYNKFDEEYSKGGNFRKTSFGYVNEKFKTGNTNNDNYKKYNISNEKLVFAKNTYFNFNDMSDLFKQIKSNNQFSFPEEWKNLNEDLFDLISKKEKNCLDTDEDNKKVINSNNNDNNANYNLYNNENSYKNKNNNNRSRAYTEVNPTSKFYLFNIFF